VSLTEDELTLVMSTNQPSGGQFNILIATRSSKTMDFPPADERYNRPHQHGRDAAL